MFSGTTLEEASVRLNVGASTDLSLVVKTDMQGSVDAVVDTLEKVVAQDRKESGLVAHPSFPVKLCLVQFLEIHYQ